MPRAESKSQLLADCEKEKAALDEVLAKVPAQLRATPGVIEHWSVKDLLAHLLEWEQMVLHWWRTGKAGGNPAVPGEGFKWSQLPALNEAIYQKYRDDSWDTVWQAKARSYDETYALVQSLSEEELFTPGLQPWMNKNTLAAYFNSCTAAHYRWAAKEIKRWLKTV